MEQKFILEIYKYLMFFLEERKQQSVCVMWKILYARGSEFLQHSHLIDKVSETFAFNVWFFINLNLTVYQCNLMRSVCLSLTNTCVEHVSGPWFVANFPRLNKKLHIYNFIRAIFVMRYIFLLIYGTFFCVFLIFLSPSRFVTEMLNCFCVHIENCYLSLLVGKQSVLTPIPLVTRC